MSRTGLEPEVLLEKRESYEVVRERLLAEREESEVVEQGESKPLRYLLTVRSYEVIKDENYRMFKLRNL